MTDQSMTALSVTLDGVRELPAAGLKALYRVTGRSSDELRRSIAAGEPVYRAALFGRDHVEVAPRLEKTIAFLREHGVPFVLHEWEGARAEPVDEATARAILGDA